jgi:5'-AMP-activated protein kinase regulatory beta subunit
MNDSSKEKKTTFACHASEAQHVIVVGSFNNWDVASKPLKKGRHGKWATKMMLPIGRYEYKFIVDGEWCCEPGCDGCIPYCKLCVANEFGTMNRVLEVQ